MKLPIQALVELADPFRDGVWWGCDRPISRGEVALAIRAGDLRAKPIVEDWSHPVGRAEHIRRVAYLVVHGWGDPVCLELGFGWPIQDGNHRLAAAIYRGDAEVDVSFSGFLEPIKEAFGVGVAEQVEAEWLACESG